MELQDSAGAVVAQDATVSVRFTGAASAEGTGAARELVKGALEDLARDGALGTSDSEAAFQVLWAVLHGLISLHLTRPDYAFAENLMETAFEMVERGLLRRGERAP